MTLSGILTITHAGQTREIPLTGIVITIGRARDNSLNFKGMQVSHHHARLQFTGERVLVTDLSSTNGTHLNGTLIEPMMPTPVKEGDSIVIGDYRLVWQKSSSTGKDTGERLVVQPTQVAVSHKPASRRELNRELSRPSLKPPKRSRMQPQKSLRY